MKKHLILLVLLNWAWTAKAQAPGGVPGVKLWYATELNEKGQSQWKDQLKGQIIEPKENQTANSSLNFNPAQQFQETTAPIKLQIPDFNPEKSTFFTVYQSQDNYSEKSLWSYTQADSTQVLLTTHRIADLSQFEYINFPKRAQSLPQINTYIQHQAKSQNGNYPPTLHLGHPPTDYQLPITAFQGLLPEFIIYDRVLSPEERQRVETYLAIKYGTMLAPTQQLDYLNASGLTIFSPAKTGDFSHQVAGIGRDDLSGLYQKQSSSSYNPNLLVISAGQQAASNSLNNTEIPDQHFLVWADNNASFEWSEKQILQPLSLDRKWIVVTTGNWDGQDTEIQFDTKHLRTPASPQETYWLIINRNASGTFEAGALEYFPLTTLHPSGKASFQDIRWNMDSSGQDVFTIAVGPKLLVHTELTLPQCNPAKNGNIRIAAIGGQAPYYFRLQQDYKLLQNWTTTDNSSQQLNDLPAGDYELIVTDRDGNEFREKFFFQSADAPAILLAQQYHLSTENSLELDAAVGAIPGLQYQWITPDGQLIDRPDLAINYPGVYQLSVSDQQCIAKQNINIQAAKASNFRRVTLFPNPSTDGRFQIRVHLEETADVILRVFDALGQIVFTQTLKGHNYYHTSSRLSVSGTYMLQLQSGTDQMTLPLIVL